MGILAESRAGSDNNGVQIRGPRSGQEFERVPGLRGGLDRPARKARGEDPPRTHTAPRWFATPHAQSLAKDLDGGCASAIEVPDEPPEHRELRRDLGRRRGGGGRSGEGAVGTAVVGLSLRKGLGRRSEAEAVERPASRSKLASLATLVVYPTRRALGPPSVSLPPKGPHATSHRESTPSCRAMRVARFLVRIGAKNG